MKIHVFQDATLDLDLSNLVKQIDIVAPQFGLVAGTARFEVPSKVISFTQSYNDLPQRLLDEIRDSDLAIMLTKKRYDNNFFWQSSMGRQAIISFYGWERLTNLPIENGFAYFLTSMVLDKIGVDLNHDRNVGCVSDFWWDKGGIDVGMRAAYICTECVDKLKSTDVANETADLLTDAEKMLDHISRASRADISLLEHLKQIEATEESFDCFLCHNSTDKNEVRALAAQLRAIGLNPWLDEEQLRPGFAWQDALQVQIQNIRSALICVGSTGFGPWQNMELRGFLSEFMDRGCPVIPVILSNVTTPPELPLFLRSLTWVDFRRTEPDPVEQLRWGITGIR